MKKVLTLLLAAVASAFAAEPPQQIDIHNLPGRVVDEVVIPVPAEIFNILDKITHPLWHEVLRPMKDVIKPPGFREQTALLLGTVIAEGFIAVEDENSEEVKNIGRSVLILAEALGVKKVVVPRSNAIIQAADGKKWQEARRELDRAQREVQEAMRELNDEPLSQLVSLGGWLRGTEALTQVVKKSYSKEGAELLHQPVLVQYFLRRIAGFRGRMKDNALVIQVKEGLEKILPLMGNGDADITEKTVEEMKSIAERLNKDIHSKN